MRMLIILFLIAAAGFRPAWAQSSVDTSTPTAAEAKQKEIKRNYEKAFLYYKDGNYGPALQIWTDILKLDPDQKTAKSMIEEARSKVEEKTRERRKVIAADIAKGKYQKALIDLQLLLDTDPTNAKYQTLQNRLEAVSRILPQASMSTKESRITVQALGGYLGDKEDLKLTSNGLRYARDLNPDDPKVARLLEMFESEHPEMAHAESITPGMKFMEYKRFVALNQIYDGKYHLAVNTLNEILALEPGDIVSLERLGSAYYALGHAAQAKTIWIQALHLAKARKQASHVKKLRKFLAHPPAMHPRNRASTTASEASANVEE